MGTNLTDRQEELIEEIMADFNYSRSSLVRLLHAIRHHSSRTHFLKQFYKELQQGEIPRGKENGMYMTKEVKHARGKKVGIFRLGSFKKEFSIKEVSPFQLQVLSHFKKNGNCNINLDFYKRLYGEEVFEFLSDQVTFMGELLAKPVDLGIAKNHVCPVCDEEIGEFDQEGEKIIAIYKDSGDLKDGKPSAILHRTCFLLEFEK